MARLLVDIDGGDGGRHLLDQGQLLLPVDFICLIDHVLEDRSPEAPGFPCGHSSTLSEMQQKLLNQALTKTTY